MDIKATEAMRDIAKYRLEKAREDLKNEVITQEDMNKQISEFILILVQFGTVVKDNQALKELSSLITVEDLIKALGLEEQHEVQ